MTSSFLSYHLLLLAFETDDWPAFTNISPVL
jgi:hypothetical protein